MLNRSLRVFYYACLRYPMRLNALRHRLLQRPRASLKVQLGPGKKHYFENWVNVDANFITAKIDIWADFTGRLPFNDDTVEAFYSHHVIEHLPDVGLPFHFAELFRCLKPGGVIRVGGPNGDVAARKLLEGDAGWFSDFPDKRNSVGGRYANFILCRGEHLTILTASYLTELATGAGFTDIHFCLPNRETRYPDIFDQSCLTHEWLPDPSAPNTIIMEARKKSAN